jgi:hypothetical protein
MIALPVNIRGERSAMISAGAVFCALPNPTGLAAGMFAAPRRFYRCHSEFDLQFDRL